MGTMMRSLTFPANDFSARLALMMGLLAALLFLPALAQASPVSPGDPCLSFLSSGLSSGFTNGSPDKANQRTAGDTTAAGKAATLSLLLGVRLALGPTEDLKGGPQSTTPDISALDIQQYRTCKKEQALRVSYLP